MIKSLLTYQAKDTERLLLVFNVEQGRAKRELDEANRTIESAKRTLLSLEEEAKTLRIQYDAITKNLSALLTQVADINKNINTKTEEDTSNSLALVSGFLSKISGYEAQLADISRKITDKTNLFEDTKAQTGRAQKNVQTYQAEYERQKKEIEPKVAHIKDELVKLEKEVTPILLDKYRIARKNASKQAKIADVVVPLSNNRCGGCYFELPLNLAHKLATDGYIVCEECGKIIYK